MQTGRRHRVLLLMLCAFIVSMLMNAGMATGVRTDTWSGDAARLSLATGMLDANATDTYGECRQTPAEEACGVDVTFVDDEWMLPAFHIASFHYVPPAAPSSLRVADLPVPVALFLRPPDIA